MKKLLVFSLAVILFSCNNTGNKDTDETQKALIPENSGQENTVLTEQKKDSLQFIKDSLDWVHLQELADWDTLYQYIENNPESKFIDKLKELKTELRNKQKEEEWQQAVAENTYEAYTAFYQHYEYSDFDADSKVFLALKRAFQLRFPEFYEKNKNLLDFFEKMWISDNPKVDFLSSLDTTSFIINGKEVFPPYNYNEMKKFVEASGEVRFPVADKSFWLKLIKRMYETAGYVEKLETPYIKDMDLFVIETGLSIKYSFRANPGDDAYIFIMEKKGDKYYLKEFTIEFQSDV